MTMTNKEILSASSAILKKTKQLGLHLAGFARVDDLKEAPSCVFSPQLQAHDKISGSFAGEMELDPGVVTWPEVAKTVLVVAVEHPEDKPELDWWHGQVSPSGNKLLIKAVGALCEWIPANFAIDLFHFPYFIDQGGIFLKDAAVMAGLGCIGRNNLLVTPEFGPRVRLRAMALSIPIPSTGPSGFDPCGQCEDLCRKSCPQHAFDEPIYSSVICNQTILPGGDGRYSRPICQIQMRKDSHKAEEQVLAGFSKPVKVIKFCRNCEWSCPVGK